MSPVAKRILAKAASGHPYIMRDMSGELVLALCYGPGKCSSSFVAAVGFSGPARPLGYV